MNKTSKPAPILVWFQLALEDAKAANALATKGHRPQALFLVQQATEKALKGMLASKGTSHSDLKRKFGHQSFASFLALQRKLSEPDFIAGALAQLIEPSLLKDFDDLYQFFVVEKGRKAKQGTTETPGKFNDVLDVLAQLTDRGAKPENLWAQVATFSPSSVELLMGTIRQIRNAITRATNRHFKLGIPPEHDDLLTWLISELEPQLFSRIPKLHRHRLSDQAKDILKQFIDLVGESRLRAELVKPIQARIDLYFKWVISYLSLYLVGVISWPHAVSVRYPMPPGAPSVPIDAADLDQLGYEHYSSEIGAIRHVGALAREAVWATGVLIKCHRAGIGIFASPDEQEA